MMTSELLYWMTIEAVVTIKTALTKSNHDTTFTLLKVANQRVIKFLFSRPQFYKLQDKKVTLIDGRLTSATTFVTIVSTIQTLRVQRVARSRSCFNHLTYLILFAPLDR